ncbi:hypothetical protein FRC17_006701 [Serendipita sp. 399]|nr:hypothetical protein FRC17_006701 [Serendipita sp. 399]
MISNVAYLHGSHTISQDIIEELLRGMRVGDVLPLHVRAQNAGVIIRRNSTDQMTFEAFEASLPTEVILQTKSKVRVTFPANPRLSFPIDSGLLPPLSNLLSYLANTEMNDAVPTTKKGGSSHHETRETSSPRYITEALAGVIRAYGAPVKTEFVHKRLDDHVLWKSALKPWRRSPLWLIVRVALQTTLNEKGMTGAEGYKAFMPHFMASILHHAIQADSNFFTLDLLYCMNAKVARRLSKLEALLNNEGHATIDAVVSSVRSFNTILEQRWKELQERFSSVKQWEAPSPSLYRGCTTILFSGSSDYLRKVINRQSELQKIEASYDNSQTVMLLCESCRPRSGSSEEQLPTLSKTKELDISLFDIENWIDLHLPSWKSSQKRSTTDVEPIFRLICNYRTFGTRHYQEKPERLSLMHLCIVELWVALDQLVTSWCPLLAEYSPEIPVAFLDPLLLPYLSQMQRLQKVQQYLHYRHDKAHSHGNQSVFGSTTSDTSFAVRFFDTTLASRLVKLENQIHDAASRQKQKKLKELQRLNENYTRLMDEASQMDCTWTTGKRKKCQCPKCKLIKSANGLRITPIEEPLPSSSNQARPIVLELGCPAVFAIWREATFDTLFLTQPTEDHLDYSESYLLSEYDTVQSYFRPEYKGSGVTLASTQKSIRRSHYGKARTLPCIESDVILQHAGRFQLFHASSKTWIKPINNATIKEDCIFKLEGMYKPLQAYMEGTSHSPNSVLASINHCPIDLSTREFIAFGQLRSGNRLQWRNLMRALRSQSLSFYDPSVFTLVLQTIWQAGPPDTIGKSDQELLYREAHQDLLEETFTSQIVDELSSILGLLQENWNQVLQLAVIVQISLRVHSLTQCSSVKKKSREVLHKARDLATRWIDSILDSERNVFQENRPAGVARVDSARQIAASIAVVLRSTYDFDNDSLRTTSLPQVEAVQLLYAGSIVSTFSGTWPKGISFLADRDHRIGLRLQKHVEAALRKDPSILLSVIFKEFKRPVQGIGGSPLPFPAERWWHLTVTTTESSKYSVHVNIINGAILIDGKPIQGLPLQITQHPSYAALFSHQQILNVRPSGIAFEATFGSSIVRFTMLKDELLIHRHEGGEIEEYLPADRLAEDLPACLVDGHYHWYSTSRSTIDVRPSNLSWEQNGAAHWQIALQPASTSLQGQLWRQASGRIQRGVDVHSGLYEHLSRSLQVIEPNKRGLLVIMETVDDTATIFVPKHSLTFSLVSSGQLECQSTPGYVLDADRSGLSTLIGLQNVLALRHRSSILPHKIMIPKGQITAIRGEYGHPVVTVDSQQSSGCLIYNVDTLVGRLVGSRSMESDLFLTKLHAYTSSPFPDPLLRRSGTREALSRLGSAASYPSNELSPFSKQVLESLALLTPKRKFYPKHLKVMETVKWDNNLPPTSQDTRFKPLVEEILAFWRRISSFHQDHSIFPTTDHSSNSSQLEDRATSRDWSVGIKSRRFDHLYLSRDSLSSDNSRDRESVAFKIAKVIQSPEDELVENPRISQDAFKWAEVVGNKHWSWQEIHNWLPADGEPSPSGVWFSLYSLCRSTDHLSLSSATIALSFLGYRGMKLNLVSCLIRVTKMLAFKQPQFAPPVFDRADLRDISQFNEKKVSELVEMTQVGFEHCVSSQLLGGHDSGFTKSHYEEILSLQLEQAVVEIKRHWPAISLSVIEGSTLLSSVRFDAIVTPVIDKWANSHHVREFISQVDSLSSKDIPLLMVEPYHYPSPIHSISHYRVVTMTLEDLLGERSPNFTSFITPNQSSRSVGNEGFQNAMPSQLSQLLEILGRQSYSEICSRYLEDLQQSVRAHMQQRRYQQEGELDPTFDIQLLEASQRSGTARARAFLGDIQSLLSPHSQFEGLVRMAGLWPDISTHALLRQLSAKKRANIPHTWAEYLTAYGLSIRDAMRFGRMVDHYFNKKDALLSAEFQWAQKWDPSKFPEWILIEIDGNFAIRGVQSDIANRMLFPEGNQNAVMQLNMGEGKSSVIIPIVASSASTSSALVRIIVPRAQSKQQLHILRRTLTDLCDHRIFLLPFHRRVTLDHQSTVDVARHLRQSASSGSIWLCEPEQILSLRLLGIDRITNQNIQDSETGMELIRLQQWLDDTTRDIIDESDEVLHTRQQVIYTVGYQQNLEGTYLRWEVPQKLLGLFSAHLALNSVDDRIFWMQKSDLGSDFPHIRCLSDEGRQTIRSFVSFSIRNNDWPIPQHLKDSAIEFVTSPSPSSASKESIEAYAAQEKEEGEPNDRLMHMLMILRGLISCDLLLHALKDKRWRVNYGLDLGRTQLAVPYRAKDYPSQRSEFGQPDITILLTCLSYYYGGLDDNMLEKLIRRLLKSSTPDLTYSEWLQSSWHRVPPDLRTIHGVNVEDKALLKERLFPLLRYNKTAIDFYLNTLVFPRDAKEYPRKLSSSGWDLARGKKFPTTGFSGTNDARFLLPITISQMDNEAHLHTNATVISHLLLKENDAVIRHLNNQSSVDILKLIMDHPSNPTVILDVGAQILDKTNLDFVKMWLSLHKDHSKIRAAIYFDEQGNLMILSRDGTIHTLLDSPYSERLDQCLTYLDEAHTRGTDLRLPDAYAVVTLGPRLTKDKLAQGCMRMRRLGAGHRLVFYVPDEVAQLVQNGNRSSRRFLTTSNIVAWSIRETWRQMHTDISNWAIQGYSFANREEGWRQIAENPPPRNIENLFCEQEGRTLASLYADFGHSGVPWMHTPDRNFQKAGDRKQLLQKIKKRCEEFGGISSQVALISEEKEIELVHEKEQEREVQRAPSAAAVEHELHQDLIKWVKKGGPLPLNTAMLPAQEAFKGTNLDRPPRGFGDLFSSLFVTRDFCRVIQPKYSEPMTRFMRPVEWIITSNRASLGFMVLISPFEANALMPLFRRTVDLRLHPFAPRNTISMRSLEDLTWFTVCSAPMNEPLPRQMVVPLNLFSGALFIRDEATYKYICTALRLYVDPDPLPDGLADKVTSVGFVWNDVARVKLGMIGPGFTMNPVYFFRKLLRYRRHGQSFRPSHMNKVLFGERLLQSDFIGDS